LSSVGQLLSPPRFPDPERIRAAWWLNLFLLLTFGILGVLLLFLLLNPLMGGSQQESILFHLMLILALGGAWAFMRVRFAFKSEAWERKLSDLRFRALAENSHDFICVWDLSSRTWVYYNRPQFLGYPTPELLHHPTFLQHLHPDDYSRVKERWLSLAEDSHTEQFEYRLCNAKGEWEWLHARERVLALDDDGNPAQILVSLHVVTGSKNQDETFRLAKEDADAAARSKSEFLANMSHEIRTPMNGVVAMTSLLQTTELSEEQRFYVNTISHSSNTLLTIINDILDLSKAESGRLGIERLPLDLWRLVEEVLDLLAPKAAEKDLELLYRIERSVPVMVLGDAARLRQVLINLVSNAIKFTAQGEVTLLVGAKARNEQDNGQEIELHFAIRDTGIGIAPDHLLQLFQPFSQADASNTRTYGGTGLGLAISKRLCELMGGRIWVESEQYVGSTFHFTLVTSLVASSIETAESHGINDAHPALERRAALIVDDNPAVRQNLQQLICEWGMVATSAASGVEALALVRDRGRFDIVVIDMQMPGMSGLVLAKELRKLVANLPIVMTSALGMPMYAAGDDRHLYDLPVVMPPAAGGNDPREAVRQLGVTSIIFKPVKVSVLRAVLLAQFDTTPSGSEADQADAPPKASESLNPNLGHHNPLHILLAEDNLTNQKVALRMLKRLGYEADVANNGLEAVQALRQQRYDVVLMDVQMPEMDGLEATRQIRTQLAASDQPYIIAMTAAAMQLDREKCLDAGMDDFLAKPARLEDLAEALIRYLPLSAGAK
jgi:PAS domain S-box-containing protein